MHAHLVPMAKAASPRIPLSLHGAGSIGPDIKVQAQTPFNEEMAIDGRGSLSAATTNKGLLMEALQHEHASAPQAHLSARRPAKPSHEIFGAVRTLCLTLQRLGHKSTTIFPNAKVTCPCAPGFER